MQTVAVIGIGRLGIGVALNLEKSGYNVIGIDKNRSHIELVNNKKLKSIEPYIEDYLNSSKNFRAYTDLREALISDIIFILVATSSLENGRYDTSQVESVVNELEKLGKQNTLKHIVILSTVNPGFCDEAAKTLEPLNYTVSYNPEFLAQGSVTKNLQEPDMIIIGENSKDAGDKIQEIYQKMCVNKPSFHRMSRLSAEIAKIAYNCFSTTKISFANSIGDLATKVGAEPEKILDALGSDSKIGSKCFKYGFGYGGPCLPKDNNALIGFANDVGMNLPISKATNETNKKHLEFQFEQYSKKYDKDKEIVFDGVTYKKGTIIIEGSQQLALAVKLAKAGYKILIKDVQDVIDQVKKIHGNLFEYQPVKN